METQLDALTTAIRGVTEPAKQKTVTSDDPKHYIVFTTKDTMKIDGKEVSMIQMWQRISKELEVKNSKAMAKAISLIFIDYQTRLAVAEAEKKKNKKVETTAV